jgi:tartrate-resistant acid phosphatase type 5
MRRWILLAGLAVAPLAACGSSAGPAAAPEPGTSFGASEVHDARAVPPLAAVPPEELAGTISFFAVGDTGYGGRVLAGVAEAMERSARERPVALALLLGDNFYPAGVRTTDDERWRTVFEEPFGSPALAVPFHAVLGNHDHRGLVDAEIAYTGKSERWRMPARWYTFTRTGEGGLTAQFFALDTEPIEEGWAEAPGEIAWLETELARSSARWKIVIGHHPALSHGRHGGTEEIVRGIVPLFERFGVDLYVTGHDHDLQLLDSGRGWLQLVSGAGSSTRDTRWSDDTLFAAASPGYARVDLGKSATWIEIATAAEGPRFRWRVAKR